MSLRGTPNRGAPYAPTLSHAGRTGEICRLTPPYVSVLIRRRLDLANRTFRVCTCRDCNGTARAAETRLTGLEIEVARIISLEPSRCLPATMLSKTLRLAGDEMTYFQIHRIVNSNMFEVNSHCSIKASFRENSSPLTVRIIYQTCCAQYK
jgi:hypothetical protein